MAKATKTEAIILRKRNLPSNDVLFSVFSEEYGKIVLFAKGVKKITSKRLPHMQTGNLVNLMLHSQNDRFYLQETNLISAFSGIKELPERLRWQYALLFIIDRLVPEMQKEPVLYVLMKHFLIDLSKSDSPMGIFDEYANSVMNNLGYTHEKKSLSEIQTLVQELTGEKIPYSSI